MAVLYSGWHLYTVTEMVVVEVVVMVMPLAGILCVAIARHL